MRTARIRCDHDRCRYHVMNRVSGCPGDLPFGDAEKAKMFDLLSLLLRFYTVEVISFVAMGNHFHAICVTYPDLPSVKEMQARFRARYGSSRPEPDWSDPAVRVRIGLRMRDLSMLMKDFEQAFSVWFNERQGRHGRLWADRFKSVVLGGGHALWECLKYVEMNPVRAGLCRCPEDYRFGTLGRLAGSGRHPFGAAFGRHLRECLGGGATGPPGPEAIAELRADIARVAAAERGECSEDIFRAEAAALRGSPVPLLVTRRVRYWSDGAVIGPKRFLTDLVRDLCGGERARRKRLAVTESHAGVRLFAWRRLRSTS